MSRPRSEITEVRKEEVGVRYFGFTAKAIGVGILLTVLNCYWIVASENRIIWELTDFSIFPTTLSTIFILALLNLLAIRVLKVLSFSSAELVTIYIMVSIGTALAGHDMVRQLIPMMGNGFWYATPENGWEYLFHKYLPKWLTVSNPIVLQGYYEGGSNFFRIQVIKAWLIPALSWFIFIVVILFVMLCINIIINKRWTEHEKLSYPIIRIIQDVVDPSAGLFSNRGMWFGFGIALFIELMAGLHYLYPAVPAPRLKYDLSPYFTERPWNAMGGMPVYIYPFAVGLGYLMPLNISLSVWFFFLFWKFQLVFTEALGVRASFGAGGWLVEQRAGAWLGLGILSIWVARRYIWEILRSAFSSRGDRMYRVAVLGLIFGLLFLVLFLRKAGMDYWYAFLYLLIFLILSISITRMRAEMGPPTHELHEIHPDRIMVVFAGTSRFGPRNLSVATILDWIAYGYRCHPMPHQLEGFKLGSIFGMREGGLAITMMIAAVVGAFSAIFFHLALYYKYSYFVWGVGEFYRLQNWLSYPIKYDAPALRQIGFGIGLTIFLMIMHRRFIWWPLHPVGYAVGSGWAISWMWFSIFLSWFIKRTLINLGGFKAYRRAMPFFLGLIIGQFFMGSMWSLIGIIVNRNMYTLFP